MSGDRNCGSDSSFQNGPGAGTKYIIDFSYAEQPFDKAVLKAIIFQKNMNADAVLSTNIPLVEGWITLWEEQKLIQ